MDDSALPLLETSEICFLTGDEPPITEFIVLEPHVGRQMLQILTRAHSEESYTFFSDCKIQYIISE